MESEPGAGSQSICATRRLSATAKLSARQLPTTAGLSARWLPATVGLSTGRVSTTTKLPAAIWYSFYSYTQCEWSYFNGHGCQCCGWTKLPVFNCRRTDFLLRRETESLCTFSCNAINSL